MKNFITLFLLISFLHGCGSSSEEAISNSDIESNNSLEESQVLNKTLQPNQENLDEDVLAVFFDAALDFETDPSDFFTIDSIDKSGMYVVSAASSSLNSEESIDDFSMDILVDDISIYTGISNHSAVIRCVYLNEDEKLTVSISTENDTGTYTFSILYFGSSTTYCDEYNGETVPEEEVNDPISSIFVHDVDGLGTGICVQYEVTDEQTASGIVSNLGYEYGSCVDSLGSDSIAYCEVDSLNHTSIRNYFTNVYTLEEAQFYCNGWSGTLNQL